jgi:transcriptional regulator with XRE-family HTH domain
MKHEGEIIKNYLKENAIRQEDFAETIGVSRNYLISTLLNKSEIPPKYKARIKAKMKVDLFQSDNNVITQNYKNVDNATSVVNEKEVEYLKQIIEAKDEIIEILKKQLNKKD